MRLWHKLVIALLLASIPAIGTARAADSARWARFDAAGHCCAAKVSRVVVKVRCINSEDSAAHLRLINYGDGRAVYGCSRKGY